MYKWIFICKICCSTRHQTGSTSARGLCNQFQGDYPPPPPRWKGIRYVVLYNILRWLLFMGRGAELFATFHVPVPIPVQVPIRGECPHPGPHLDENGILILMPAPSPKSGDTCSSPVTWTPYFGKKIIPPISGGMGYHCKYEQHPLSREVFPRLYAPQNTHFPEKMGTRLQPPYAFEWGRGRVLISLTCIDDVDMKSSQRPRSIVTENQNIRWRQSNTTIKLHILLYLEGNVNQMKNRVAKRGGGGGVAHLPP